MMHRHHPLDQPHLHARYSVQTPPSESSNFEAPTKRSSGSSSKCTPGKDSPGCTYPTDNSATLPIVLGVLIPIGCTLIAILYLTRRNRRRQRLEDANDKHASLDFGLGEVHRTTNGKKGKKRHNEPPMMDLNAEREFRQNRGLSLDLGSSPYVLAAEHEESRPSLNSISRTGHDQEDPYKPVAFLSRASSPNNFLSRSGSKQDSASMFTQSSDGNGYGTLLRNAQYPSDNSLPSEAKEHPLPNAPPVIDIPLPSTSLSRKPVGPDFISEPETQQPESSFMSQNPRATSPPNVSRPQEAEQGFLTVNLNRESEPPAHYGFPTIEITPTPPEEDVPPPPPEKSPARNMFDDPVAPSAEKRAHSMEPYDEYATYADVLGIVQKESIEPFVDYDDQMHGLGVQGVDYDARRLSASIRPLPPDDPSDNPEIRANRIRSFYKEYFDESKRDTNLYLGGFISPEYYEDYGQEYLDGATVFDPETGQFVVGSGAPYAEPVTRRAMTPPPRAPPRYGGAANRYFGSGQFGPGGHRPRGYSSASGADPRGRGPRKPVAPPKPLNNLPTPHLLRDDSAIFSAIDFAPPLSARERAVGRPDSPFAEQRPFSPTVRAFTPLSSPFDDLAAMPSPHHLRKSGTFTALDFAPPPRLKSETASDAGSIRSGRSNMSASQLANVRAGIYRVSRIPKEYVGTRTDFSESLRPTWELRGPTPGLS